MYLSGRWGVFPAACVVTFHPCDSFALVWTLWSHPCVRTAMRPSTLSHCTFVQAVLHISPNSPRSELICTCLDVVESCLVTFHPCDVPSHTLVCPSRHFTRRVPHVCPSWHSFLSTCWSQAGASPPLLPPAVGCAHLHSSGHCGAILACTLTVLSFPP